MTRTFCFPKISKNAASNFEAKFVIQVFWKFWSRNPKFPKTLGANFAFSKFLKILENTLEILRFPKDDFKNICIFLEILKIQNFKHFFWKFWNIQK